MAVIARLEFCPCAPDVNFLRAVVGGDITFIDDGFVLAVFFGEWTHPAGLAVTFLLVGCGIRLMQELGIVASNNPTYIRHAAV